MVITVLLWVFYPSKLPIIKTSEFSIPYSTCKLPPEEPVPINLNYLCIREVAEAGNSKT